MIAVHFGAGNIGLGFIGMLLSEAGYEVRFVDVSDERVSLLNERGEYKVTLANADGDTKLVRSVSAVHGKDQERVAAAVAEADIVTTAVGVTALPYLAPSIAEGIKLRKSASEGPLVFIACENAIGGSTILKRHVMERLSAELPESALAAKDIFFPDAAVDRIVPIQQHADPLQVTVEPFFEWIVEGSALPADFPEIAGMQRVDNLEPYIERKLFTVNTGHCSAAYFGALQGYETIQDAMLDPEVAQSVLQVLNETGAVLVRTHGLNEQEHEQYIHKILDRFRNPYLIDEIARVGRSPIRKLSPQDRLVRPLLLADGLGIETPGLIRAIAAGLRFENGEDSEAKELQEHIHASGISSAITHYTGIEAGHRLHQAIVHAYEQLSQEQGARK